MSNIIYASDPDSAQASEWKLVQDLLNRHSTVPNMLRVALIMSMSTVADWLLGLRSFDEMIDYLGTVNDNLSAPTAPGATAESKN